MCGLATLLLIQKIFEENPYLLHFLSMNFQLFNDP